MHHFLLVISSLAFVCCEPSGNRTPANASKKPSNNSIKHAKHFGIEEREGYCLVTLCGKKNAVDTTSVFVLYDSLKPVLKFNQTTYFVKVPCTKIVALSSIYSAMLAELNALKRLVAIDNVDYANQSEIIAKRRSGHLMEVSKGPELDLEKTLLLQPDMVFMFGMGNSEDESPPQLLKAGIPVALIVDHLEETPLARAEWIKFIGAFVGQGKPADSIFTNVEKKYLTLKDSMRQFDKGPKVLSELKYGETWYVPGGKSFMSSFINDAGGQYAWKDNTEKGSLPLSFEQVYRIAGDAEVWINLSMVTNQNEMLSEDERYQKFKAFQTNRLYNNNKRVNAKGYSDYWETAMFHPDRVLRDLILIFHKPHVDEKELYYYRKIH
jgi:iron complex transport system substrate-binding protein